MNPDMFTCKCPISSLQCHDLLSCWDNSTTMEWYINTWLLLGSIVFLGTRNFTPGRRICPFPRNFCICAEYCGIQYWPVIRGSGSHRKLITVFIHNFTMKYMTATRALTREILNLCEILPVNLVDQGCPSFFTRGRSVQILNELQARLAISQPTKQNKYNFSGGNSRVVEN